MSGRSQRLICRMKVKNSHHNHGLNAWIRSSGQSFRLSLRANAPRTKIVLISSSQLNERTRFRISGQTLHPGGYPFHQPAG